MSLQSYYLPYTLGNVYETAHQPLSPTEYILLLVMFSCLFMLTSYQATTVLDRAVLSPLFFII